MAAEFFNYALRSYDEDHPNAPTLDALRELARKEAVEDLVDKYGPDLRYPEGIEGKLPYSVMEITSPYGHREPHQVSWKAAQKFADKYSGAAGPGARDISVKEVLTFLTKGADAGIFDGKAIPKWQHKIMASHTIDVKKLMSSLDEIRVPETKASQQKFDQFMAKEGKFLLDAMPRSADEILQAAIAGMFRKKGIPVKDPAKETVNSLYSSLDMTLGAVKALKAMVSPSKKIFLIATPYFEPAIAIPNRYGFEPQLINTDDSNLTLTADKLQKAIDHAGGAKHVAGVLITSPNHMSQMPVPREELEKIAKIVVKNNLHVICDEIYDLRAAGTKGDEATSLASLTVTVDGTPRSLHNYVFTSDGTSKRYNMHGEDGYPKGGFGTTGDVHWMKEVQDALHDMQVAQSTVGINSDSAVNKRDKLLLASMLENTPDSYFKENVHHYKDVNQRLDKMLQHVRAKYHLSPQDLAIRKGPDSAFLQLLEISPEILKKIDIHNAEQLNEYVMSYTGVSAHSMAATGSKIPGLRINASFVYGLRSDKDPHLGANVMEECMDRIGEMVDQIKKGKAPAYKEIGEQVDQLIEYQLRHDEKEAASAQKYNIRQQRHFASR